MSGAYYRISKSKDANVPQNCLGYFVLYKNRIATIGTLCRNETTFSVHDSIPVYINYEFELSKKDGGNEFGGFAIDGRKIKIQVMRYTPQLIWSPLTFQGEIIDDTTIMINRIELKERNIISSDSIYYHFIPMTKPDSLESNRWKNKDWYWQ